MAKSKPDQTPDRKAIDIVTELFNDHLDPSLQIQQRIWERNLLYYIGEQHLSWINSQQIFQRRGRGKRKNTPTPTSNIIRDYVRSMKAMILNKSYSVRVWPNSNNQDDKDAAKIGGELLRHMDTMDDDAFDIIKEWLAIQLILFGTSFCRTYPAMESGEMAITKDGVMTTGDVGDEVVLPFNLRFDSYGDTLRKKRHIGIKSLKDREWVEDTFHVNISVGDDQDKMDYQKRLMKLVSNVSPWKGAGIDGRLFDIGNENMVVFKEVEMRPTLRFPNGRYIVAVGDKILKDDKKMPIPVDKGKFYYTITDFHYHYVPGRFISDPGVNDQISPQDSINSIDASLEMNRKGLGRPIVSLPAGGGVKRLNQFGQAMIVLEVDTLLTGGAMPTVDRGLALPKQVLEERQTKIQTSQMSAGNPANILAGSSASPQSSGKQIDVLRESAEQGHTPDVKRYYKSLKEVYTKRLVLAKLIYSEERMIKIAGKGEEVQVKQFKGSDLRNNTDVCLELDSSATTTKTGQTMQITEMAKSGVFNTDSTIPPGVQHELMKKVGITDFDTATNVHIERSERENSYIAAATDESVEKVTDDNGEIITTILPGLLTTIDVPNEQDPSQPAEKVVISHDPAFKLENHVLCMETHLEFILSPEFRHLPEFVQGIAINHYDAHNWALQQQQQSQTKAAMEQEIFKGQMEAKIAEAKKPEVAGTG